jgi:beta-glucuronidase
MKHKLKFTKTLFFILFLSIATGNASEILLNPYLRNNVTYLNGKWNAIIDQYSQGENRQFFLNIKNRPNQRRPTEYTFNDGFRLDVPGDFNSQYPELMYYEGNVWYQREFNYKTDTSKKALLYFAGASYITKVWVNTNYVGEHEGGFTPFQFDITRFLKSGKNDIVVLINNNRRVDYIPAMNFDWWNFGGITRDVMLIETPLEYINNYYVQLKKNNPGLIEGYVQLEGTTGIQQLEVSIPELKLKRTVTTNEKGYASFELKAKPQLWSPETPKLYDVVIATTKDTVTEPIGFRTIETKGSDVLLNGKPLFLKGVNFHEEIPQRFGRAFSEADAAMILHEVKELGCNFIRPSHYPQNEHIVRMAERMGIMIWEEIPVWQGIRFTDDIVRKKAEQILEEMVYRDKNRAAVIMWSIQNETTPSPARDEMLIGLVNRTRKLDNTRLVVGAFNNVKYNAATTAFELQDKLTDHLDLIGVNLYLGWYLPFPIAPEKLQWDVTPDKPVVFSEFGCESQYGQSGDETYAASWSEDFMKKLYIDNLRAFENMKNLRGTVPWLLFDFRSPNRWHNQHQNGWNRKGLVSDKGLRKQAWYVVRDYYNSK